MNVLAFDTSMQSAAIALSQAGRILYEKNHPIGAKHGDTLLPYIEEALSACAFKLEAVDLIAVGIGPGSFTGTRVGVSTAKALAYGISKPVVGVISLEVLAASVEKTQVAVAPLVDAYKGEVFAALYQRLDGHTTHELVSPFHAPPNETGKLLQRQLENNPVKVLGSGLRRYATQFLAQKNWQFLDPQFDLVRAAVLAELALLKYQRQGGDNLHSLEPCYVRASDAQLPKPHVFSKASRS